MIGNSPNPSSAINGKECPPPPILNSLGNQKHYLQSQDSHPNSSYARSSIEQLTKKFLDHRKDGRVLYFITFTYPDPKDFPLTPSMADRRLRKAHRQLLKYLCGSKNYHLPSFRSVEPEIYAFLDRPGSKRKRYKPGTLPGSPSGFHHHCIVAADPSYVGKLEALLSPEVSKAFVESNKRHAPIRTMNVQRMGNTDRDVFDVVDYAAGPALRNHKEQFSFAVFGPMPNADVKQRQTLNSDAATRLRTN